MSRFFVQIISPISDWSCGLTVYSLKNCRISHGFAHNIRFVPEIPSANPAPNSPPRPFSPSLCGLALVDVFTLSKKCQHLGSDGTQCLLLAGKSGGEEHLPGKRHHHHNHVSVHHRCRNFTLAVLTGTHGAVNQPNACLTHGLEVVQHALQPSVVGVVVETKGVARLDGSQRQTASRARHTAYWWPSRW